MPVANFNYTKNLSLPYNHCAPTNVSVDHNNYYSFAEYDNTNSSDDSYTANYYDGHFFDDRNSTDYNSVHADLYNRCTSNDNPSW